MDIFNPLEGAQFALQSVAYTGTAGSTTGWPAGPQGVAIWSTTDAVVVVGESVTATASVGMPLPANTPVVFKVPQGTGARWRVSAIQLSAGGTVLAKPCNIS
jgi:hypothetical protein